MFDVKLHTRKAVQSFLVATALLLQITPAEASSLHLNSGNQQLTLIELYTSQGCSSCPPAERWLGKFQDDPRLWEQVIPIAFHVDYWDYIGWKDQLAKPEFSTRQQRYRQERGINSVYTPGFVVNGKEWRSWFGLRALPENSRQVGELQLDLEGEKLAAYFKTKTTIEERLTLNVALLGVGLKATVTRGENAGKKLSQDFVVLEHLTTASSNGSWNMQIPQINLADGERLALVAWVSHADRLEPLQAIGGWMPQTM